MIRGAALAMVLAALGACAPYVQPPLHPAADFAGPAIRPRDDNTGVLVMEDGARLPYLHWAPEGRPTAVVVALHGMNDHDASFRLAGPWWAEHGVETYAYDQRGFGQAPGRGLWAGQDRMVEDVRQAVALVRGARPGVPVVVIGESMGGSVAVAAFASDRPPAADRVILLAPGVWGWSSQPLANRAALWLAARAMGDLALEPPEFVARLIRASSNTAELVRNGRDPDSILATRFDAVSGLVDLMETASRHLGDIRTPALLMYGANDQVVEKGPMKLALQRAGSPPNLRTAYYEKGWHLLNRDLDAETVYRDVLAYLADPAAPLPSGAPPVLPALIAESSGR
ncbi:lysophospholipase [Brevundimonas sp. Leaf363]|uniref:alpha/beta fold hydrolase n=1 Tax=Brevundimonas sp. Leaf363 TaxID=1736353 RepID=UPI000700CE6F|nr:alpha/beta fold hydrolase [Brevundimonas sp. Leaf363]KQS55591.1 lysophospholipase [Brevundimonas sp. Leaf363]